MQYDRPVVRGIRMQDLNALVNSAVNKDVVVVILDALVGLALPLARRRAATGSPRER